MNRNVVRLKAPGADIGMHGNLLPTNVEELNGASPATHPGPLTGRRAARSRSQAARELRRRHIRSPNRAEPLARAGG